MPPRVAFWTSAFEPEMEAVAAEVAVLRRRFSGSVVWGLSHRHWFRLSPDRGWCVHPRLHLVFRAVTRMLEPAFDINHVFGSLGDWFYLEGRRRRPTVVTMAVFQPPVPLSLLRRVDRFVVEHPAGCEWLATLGIDASRIRLIFPPVDLSRFRPTSPPSEPFTVLFASSPDRESWLAARGVPAILEAAALRPEMRFRLLWRPWGNSEKLVRQRIEHHALRNVELVVGRISDMAHEYRRAHVTVAPFTVRERSKPAPNSLIESLACGRPVLLSDVVGLADMIEEGGAGVVSSATGEALADGLDRLRTDWAAYSARARELAERWFDVNVFCERYARLYAELGTDTTRLITAREDHSCRRSS
jgi:glycosyltransferase involved in cell wall biosynthesis